MQLKLFSWNATGIMTGIPYLTSELRRNEISVCGLSEHWLGPHNACILNSIDTDYSAFTVTSRSPSVFNGRHIYRGGVSLLWHKSLDRRLELLDIDSDRLIAAKLFLHDISVVIVQVYLPTSSHGIDMFKTEVNKLHCSSICLHSHRCHGRL